MQLQTFNIAYVIIHRTGKFRMPIHEWNCMPEIQKTWVRFKQFLGHLAEIWERRPISPLKTRVCIMPTWRKISTHGYMKPCNKKTSRRRLRRLCRRLWIMWETRWKTQGQLATQLQKMQAMMQATQMKYAAAPHGTRKYYGGRQYSGGRGYHGNQSSYRGWVGCGAQHNRNWRGGRGGRAKSNLTHYCWTHGICAYPGKDCMTPADVHQKDAVWHNKMSGSKRNCTWKVGSIPASKTDAEEIKPSNTSELLCISILDPP